MKQTNKVDPVTKATPVPKAKRKKKVSAAAGSSENNSITQAWENGKAVTCAKDESQ